MITVTPPWFYNMPPYLICRRYREFAALFKGLARTFGKPEVACGFPKKKPIGKLNQALVAKRQQALQAFLAQMSGHARAGAHKLIQDFYGKRSDDPGDVTGGAAKPATGAGSRCLSHALPASGPLTRRRPQPAPPRPRTVTTAVQHRPQALLGTRPPATFLRLRSIQCGCMAD